MKINYLTYEGARVGVAFTLEDGREVSPNGDGDLKLALTDTDRALAKARGEG